MCVECLTNINLTSKNITLSTLKDISYISTKFFYYSKNLNKIKFVFKKSVSRFLINFFSKQNIKPLAKNRS